MDNFTTGFMVLGILISILMTSPAFYYYFKYKEEPENSNPYILDLDQEMEDPDGGKGLEMNLLEKDKMYLNRKDAPSVSEY